VQIKCEVVSLQKYYQAINGYWAVGLQRLNYKIHSDCNLKSLTKNKAEIVLLNLMNIMHYQLMHNMEYSTYYERS
jgi:hypothetical protein